MIVKGFGNTTVYICESTARVAIKNPDIQNLNALANFVFDNNYICFIIYSEDQNTSNMLLKKIGGHVVNEEIKFNSKLNELE